MISQPTANGKQGKPGKTVLMLLTNAYDPDARVRQEALALLGMGWRVRLLAWDRDLKSAASELMEGVEVERIFLRSSHGRGNTQLFFYALLYLKMLWRAWRIRFDVVHCHDLDTLPIGFIAAKLKRKPIVYDAHESFPDMLEGSIHPSVKKALVALENFFIRKIDLLITVGNKLRRHFEERVAAHAVVVGNWKKLKEYSRTEAENREVRRRLGIPNGALTVVCITQLLKDRQIEELLQAIDESDGVYALIGGKGELETMIRARAAANPRIIYLGFVKAPEIPIYTCAADVVYYGFDPANPNARFSAPNKLFEALAAGKPLITGDFGEIGEVTRRGSCGIVLDSYTASNVRHALEALRNVAFREECARNAGRLGQSEMNWEKCEEVLEREYAALLKGGTLRDAVHYEMKTDREEALDPVSAGQRQS